MKKLAVVFVIVAVACIGCAKKEQVSSVNQQARKALIEGAVFLKQGDPVKAVESFAEAIKIDPSEFDGYFMLGETFLRLKQFRQAHSVMSTAVQKFPDNGLAYYLLALTNDGLGQTVPAIVAARRSVDLFTAQNDKQGAQRSVALLGVLVSAAKKEAEEKMVANAAKDAEKAVQSRAVESQPATAEPVAQ